MKKDKDKKSKAFESLMRTLEEIDLKHLRPIKEEADKSPYKLSEADKPKKAGVTIEIKAGDDEEDDELEREYMKRFSK